MNRSLISLMCCVLFVAHAAAAALAQEGQLQLPSPRELLERGVPSRPVVQDTYRLGKTTLTCDLPNGEKVGIALVNDDPDYAFLAVQTGAGPTILANEKYVHSRDPAYAVFSFYRQCGMHALGKVQATGIDDNTAQDKQVIKGAECLAVMPTLDAFKQDQADTLALISRKLQEEYGQDTAVSLAELKRCAESDYVKGVVSPLQKRQ